MGYLTVGAGILIVMWRMTGLEARVNTQFEEKVESRNWLTVGNGFLDRGTELYIRVQHSLVIIG